MRVLDHRSTLLTLMKKTMMWVLIGKFAFG
jgi:hypothetical protein